MRGYLPHPFGEHLCLPHPPPRRPLPGGAGHPGGGHSRGRGKLPLLPNLSHKELLGTWLENAAGFAPGDAVPGIVRGVRDYGVFIELTPNLSGLADWRGDLRPGERVSVYIKSIRPESRKVKLQIIQDLGPAGEPEALRYFITDGVVKNWIY